MRYHRSALIGIALGLLSLIFRAIAGNQSGFVERWYSRGLFVGLRYAWDYTLGWSPLPLLYVAVMVGMILLVRRLMRGSAAGTTPTRNQRLWNLILKPFGWIGYALALFFVLWGFNYARIPFETQVGLAPEPLDIQMLRQELALATPSLLSARLAVVGADTSAFDRDDLPENTRHQLRTTLEAQLRTWKFPTPGRVRSRIIYPKGLLIGLGASGIYLPWLGEGHYDAALHPLQYPPTIAHEMGHGYGFTDEGVCNFLGYLACVSSGEPLLIYAGRLDHWQSLANALARADRPAFDSLLADLPLGVTADLRALRERRKRYRPWFGKVSRTVYDQYLKSQGIKEGILSYNRLAMLVRAMRLKEQS